MTVSCVRLGVRGLEKLRIANLEGSLDVVDGEGAG